MRSLFEKSVLSFLCITFLCAPTIFAGTLSGDSQAIGTASASPSVNQSANTAKKQNDSGKAMSMAMAAMLAAAAAMEAAQCPTNSSQCAMAALHAGMAALSLMQAGAHDDSAGQSAATAADTNAIGSTDKLSGTGTASLTSQTADMQKLTKGIGGVKADFSKGTVSVNGKDYPASSFSSPSSMSGAGFSSDQVAAAMAFADKAAKKAESKYGSLTAANGYEEGGGSGGGGMGSSSSSGDSAANAGGLGLGSANRNPAQVAGMQKNFNGEPIGVAADSIFEMMNRRYKVKDRQNAFIDENDLLLQK